VNKKDGTSWVSQLITRLREASSIEKIEKKKKKKMAICILSKEFGYSVRVDEEKRYRRPERKTERRKGMSERNIRG